MTARQARTRKFDSRAEKVIARVARQVDMKAKMKLVFRQYLFGPYDIGTNIWATSTPISFVGIVTPLAAIQKVDNSTSVSVNPVVNQYQTPTTHVSPGGNVIANILSYDGFRRGSWISCHGLQLDFRGKVQAQGDNTGQESLEKVTLYLQVCLMQWDGSDAVAAVPQPYEAGNMVPLFGYNRKIDQDVFDLSKPFKRKVLYKTKIVFVVQRYHPDLKRFSKYIRFKKPIKILYKEADQNGQQIENWKPFLILRSSVPSHQDYDDFRPQINMCTTLHYTDT